MPVIDDTRTRLIDAAGQVFAEKGFRAANVREICQLARANVAAVNYHFGDKEQLYLESVRSAYQSCAANVPLPQWPNGTPPAQKLRDFVQTLLRRVLSEREPAWHMQLWMRELAQPTSACAEWVREYVRPMAQLLGGVLREILPSTDPKQITLIAFSIVGQCLHYRLSRPVVALLVGEQEHSTYTIERLTEHITNFSLAALGLSPPLGTKGVSHEVDRA
jgi:TetR/AcrR family transcriptional regulator, regulator of cefoperazone and chloramphenicol sensitivity